MSHYIIHLIANCSLQFSRLSKSDKTNEVCECDTLTVTRMNLNSDEHLLSGVSCIDIHNFATHAIYLAYTFVLLGGAY